MSSPGAQEPVESPVHHGSEDRKHFGEEPAVRRPTGSGPDASSVSVTGSASGHTSGDTGDPRIMRGYLMKQTRDGRWQRRWFELNGCFLTYYKNAKMKKLLAVLNLLEVSDIGLVTDAEEIQRFAGPDVEPGSLYGMLFIQLQYRKYILRADDKATAMAWISALSDVREAEEANESFAMPGQPQSPGTLQRQVNRGEVKDVNTSHGGGKGGMLCCMTRTDAIELRDT